MVHNGTLLTVRQDQKPIRCKMETSEAMRCTREENAGRRVARDAADRQRTREAGE